MALPRIYSLARVFVSRGSSTRVASSVFLSARTTTPYRSFASNSRFLQEHIQNDTTSSPNSITPASLASIPEEQQRKNARSVKVLKVPRRTTRSALEAMFNDAGYNVVEIYMQIDRFRYEGDTHASVELADEQQAQKAVETLNGNESLGNKVFLRALNPDFTWGGRQPSTSYSHLVRNDDGGIRQAVQPLAERRRVRISVKSPAWGNKGDTVSQRNKTDLKVIEQTFEPFGIESISRLAPQYGHSTFNPKYFCHIDFATKEGADDAVRTIHDTEVQSVKVWAKHTEVDAAKAYQIGRLDKALLAELQQKGLAPSDSEIDEDWVSKTAKKNAMNFDRHRNGKVATREPLKPAYRSLTFAE